MNARGKFCIICLSVLLSVLNGLAESAKCEQNGQIAYKVIRLLSDEIVPSTATIPIGTVVVWVNEDPETANIQFFNKDHSVSSCDGSARFRSDPGKVISVEVPFAKLESICLIQKGEFNYTVKRGNRTLDGKIIIQ